MFRQSGQSFGKSGVLRCVVHPLSLYRGSLTVRPRSGNCVGATFRRKTRPTFDTFGVLLPRLKFGLVRPCCFEEKNNFEQRSTETLLDRGRDCGCAGPSSAVTGIVCACDDGRWSSEIRSYDEFVQLLIKSLILCVEKNKPNSFRR